MTVMRAWVLACLVVIGIAGCATTTIIDSENPSSQRPPQWLDYWGLPITVHGATPGLSEPMLMRLLGQSSAAQGGRRIVLYLNPSRMPAEADRCRGERSFVPGVQTGVSAYLVGALCDGNTVVTTATARILSDGITPAQVAEHLQMMHLQLWQALTYGNNHPDLRFPGQMYGP